jgi:hypothetical protein
VRQLIAGVGCVVLVAVAASAQEFIPVGAAVASAIAFLVKMLFMLIAMYGLFMGGYMTDGSRIGKLRALDRLLDQLAELTPWQGKEAELTDNQPLRSADHHQAAAENRLNALDEMLCVPRPGGMLVLAGIACFTQHRQQLRAASLSFGFMSEDWKRS